MQWLSQAVNFVKHTVWVQNGPSMSRRSGGTSPKDRKGSILRFFDTFLCGSQLATKLASKPDDPDCLRLKRQLEPRNGRTLYPCLSLGRIRGKSREPLISSLSAQAMYTSQARPKVTVTKSRILISFTT